MDAALKSFSLLLVAGLLVVQTSDNLFAPPASETAWAVVIGISRYEILPKDLWLDFADADADAFSKFIGSAQGLRFLPDHVITLTNEQATEKRVRSAIAGQVVKRTKPGDSVYIFLAMHGVVEPIEPHDGFLIAYDTDHRDPAGSGINFSHLRRDIQERLAARSIRVMLLTDACHSGRLAESGGFPDQVRRTPDAFGLLASRAEESSLEGIDFGGGHGAFTYHLLRGLQGEADFNKNGVVEFSELKTYLQKAVPSATSDRQHPEPFGKPPTDFGFSKVDELRADLGFERRPLTEPATLIVDASAGSEVFVNERSSGVVPAEGRLRAGVFPPDNYKVMAVAPNGQRAVQEIQISGDPTEVAFDGKTLWTAPAKARGLPAPDVDDEDAGQQVLLAYLKGNAVKLSAADFDRCAQLFQRAQSTSVWPEHAQARGAFCAGRAAIERRDFNRAATLVDQSIRLEPGAGYAYNARGLLRMEQRAYRPAIAEFDAASQRAPRWPYPRFNAALAWTALNQTARAAQEYRRAIQLGPRDAYLHHSLAGLYMRINQPDRAEQEYRRALELDLDPAVAHNALGLFFRSRSRNREAETEFRRALQFLDRDIPARLNLARLYEDQNEPKRSEQELLDGAARVQSPLIHTALGDLYTRQRRTREAGEQYRRAAELERQP